MKMFVARRPRRAVGHPAGSVAATGRTLGYASQRASARARGFLQRLATEAGQTLTEYAVLLAVLATVAFGLLLYRDSVSAAFMGVNDCLQGDCSGPGEEEEGQGHPGHCDDQRGRDDRHGRCAD